jgi:hypothetical protein
MEDPMRMKVLMESEEPRCKKSRTDNEDPSLVMP